MEDPGSGVDERERTRVFPEHSLSALVLCFGSSCHKTVVLGNLCSTVCFFVSRIMVSVYILPCMPCLLTCKRVQSMRGSRRPTEDVSSMFSHFSVVGPASPLIRHTRKCPPALPSFTFISNRATDRGMEGLPCVMC